ncbi:hypothetical protein HAX54_049785 [Datura stramonium]|uniref:Uncharacterized protein n=1 Tax=Datura stramonium TaxID=4076 RepID=A0ABS8SW68_DATST|nr:hypothetical protein [Datura stramonium]
MEDAQIYGHSICENGEEDYIELEVLAQILPSLIPFQNSIPSPPQPQEFEFQMLPSFIDRNTTSSTADELFYNGKLLPLDHIPLHNNPISNKFLHVDDETSKRPKWSKGSLTRKLKLIKQLSFDHSRIKCLINNSVKLVSKKEVFGRIHHHSRKSFSGAIKRLLTAKSSSSSSSTSKNSNGNNIQEMHLLMRNMSDMYAEVDPIQAGWRCLSHLLAASFFECPARSPGCWLNKHLPAASRPLGGLRASYPDFSC